eukprot:SAG31_NODE_38074_length_299_cov_0.775000_1_plen_41_part_01
MALYGLVDHITSMTVVANWTDRSTALLKRAVQKVLDQNPFL